MNCSVSHFPTCIACIPQLLHILITLLGFFFLLLLLWFALCAQAPAPSRSSKAWASQDNATLRQSDRKRLKSFLAGTGETSKQCHKNRQMLWLCFTRFYIGTSTHTHTQIHLHTYRHTHAYTEKQPHMAHCHTHRLPCSAFRERECEVKQTNACTPLRPTLLSLNITSLTAPLVPSSSASSYEI